MLLEVFWETGLSHSRSLLCFLMLGELPSLDFALSQCAPRPSWRSRWALLFVVTSTRISLLPLSSLYAVLGTAPLPPRI